MSKQTFTRQNRSLSDFIQWRTDVGAAGLSAKGQSRPMHRSKIHLYLTTSSAGACRRFSCHL